MNAWQQFVECPSQLPLLSLTMGFYSRTQGKKRCINSRKRWTNGTGSSLLLVFYSQQRLLIFLVPFSVETLNFELILQKKETWWERLLHFFFMCSPKNSETMLSFYHLPHKHRVSAVVFTSVNPRRIAGAFYLSTVVGSCPASITAGVKHVGGGKREIAFHTTGLGWTSQ